MVMKPNVNSAGEKELARVAKDFDEYKDNIEKLAENREHVHSKKETEPQAKLSQEDISKSHDIYLKPCRTINSVEKFNEKWREMRNFDCEYTQFVAENAEIIGETIDLWTKPYPGMPAEEWKVPVNVPVWGPRHLEEQLKRCCYRVFSMDQSKQLGNDGTATYYGSMVVDNVKQRLDARPVSTKRTVFMGARNFR